MTNEKLTKKGNELLEELHYLERDFRTGMNGNMISQLITLHKHKKLIESFKTKLLFLEMN